MLEALWFNDGSYQKCHRPESVPRGLQVGRWGVRLGCVPLEIKGSHNQAIIRLLRSVGQAILGYSYGLVIATLDLQGRCHEYQLGCDECAFPVPSSSQEESLMKSTSQICPKKLWRYCHVMMQHRDLNNSRWPAPCQLL